MSDFDLNDLISRALGGPGARPDGTAKGQGWLGELPTSDGQVMTELTASSDVDGAPMQYPLITPNQGFKDLSNVLTGGRPTPEMYEQAIKHAIHTKMSGRKSPYVYDPFAGD